MLPTHLNHFSNPYPLVLSLFLRSVCVCVCPNERTNERTRSIKSTMKISKCFNALYFKFQLFTFCSMCCWFRLFFFPGVLFFHSIHRLCMRACFFLPRFGRFECSHQVNDNKSWWFISRFVCLFFPLLAYAFNSTDTSVFAAMTKRIYIGKSIANEFRPFHPQIRLLLTPVAVTKVIFKTDTEPEDEKEFVLVFGFCFYEVREWRKQ